MENEGILWCGFSCFDKEIDINGSVEKCNGRISYMREWN
jgi:hypothetical protein